MNPSDDGVEEEVLLLVFVLVLVLGVDWACAGRRRASPEPMARVLIPDAIPAIEFLALNKKNKNEIYSRR